MVLLLQVFADEPSKSAWLSGKLPEFIDAGDVVLFVGQRARVEELVARLTSQGVRAGGIHGDMDQVRCRYSTVIR
jgi:superfamily II DNA/RNA helicase